jgi:hypothetical protein
MECGSVGERGTTPLSKVSPLSFEGIGARESKRGEASLTKLIPPLLEKERLHKG